MPCAPCGAARCSFTEADNDPGRNLVMIDDVLAAKAFQNQSAVGQRILIRIRTPEPEFVEIIGVVAHQRVTSLAGPGLGGIALGLAGAFILTRAMTTMLVGVTPTDPVTFLAMGLIFIVVAAVSSWLPARGAAARDPAAALRGE